MERYGEVAVNCGDREEARRIADELIARRLAACVHLAPIDSVYEWDGSVVHDQEISLTAKTRTKRSRQQRVKLNRPLFDSNLSEGCQELVENIPMSGPLLEW